MKINKNFPIYNIGDILEVNPSEQAGATEVEVERVWYPKEGDRFSETTESKTLGYCWSNPDSVFPQLVCRILKSDNKNHIVKSNSKNLNKGREYNYILLTGEEYSKLIK